jgi:hypothetical protein
MAASLARSDRVRGGYVLIPVVELCSAWAAYRTSRIKLFDLRVWLAAKEMAARRSFSSRERRAIYTTEELHRLVGGVGGQHVRASLRRLRAASLAVMTGESLSFPDSKRVSDAQEGTPLGSMLAAVQLTNRSVPVPRRLLRLLAREGTRVGIATRLAHLIRCVFRRRFKLVAIGRCAASWVASVFGVDERRVKEERKRLLKEGWLVSVEDPTWARNRWGMRVQVNLDVVSEAAPVRPRGLSTSKKAPPQLPPTTDLPPPVSNRKLLTEYKHQKPASGRAAGARAKQEREASPGREPTWRDVTEADLRDTARLLELHRQGVQAGFVERGEHVRLQFVTAAEHARAVAKQNPAGLFVRLVRRRLWHFATQADEDQARGRLRAFDAVRPVDVPGKRTGPAGKLEQPEICWKNLLDFLGFEFPAPGRAAAP